MKKIKLIILFLSVICLFTLTGFQYQPNHQKKSSNNTNASQNKSQLKKSSRILVSIPLDNVTGKPTINFKVPSGWRKEKIGGGSAGGYDWVNPKNTHQKISLLMSGTVGAMQNEKTGKWDVTGIFGGGTKRFKWINISSDRLKADFVDSRISGQTGYGTALIVQSVPVAVSLEVWGTKELAKPILTTFQLLK
jgi:hypothetical protein